MTGDGRQRRPPFLTNLRIFLNGPGPARGPGRDQRRGQITTTRGEVLRPQTVFPPGSYTGNEGDVSVVLRRLCDRMGVPVESVAIEFDDDPDVAPDPRVPVVHRFSGAAGEYRYRDGMAVMAIRRRQLQHPVALAATLAHELAHARLLGERRIDPGRSDGEQLTDLATIFFGTGIFTANAAFDFSQTRSGWQSSHLGYLGETLSGYALAYFAYLRSEREPAWAAALRQARSFAPRRLPISADPAKDRGADSRHATSLQYAGPRTGHKPQRPARIQSNSRTSTRRGSPSSSAAQIPSPHHRSSKLVMSEDTVTTVGLQEVYEFKLVTDAGGPPISTENWHALRSRVLELQPARSATLEGEPPRSIRVEGFGGTEMAPGLLADLERLAGTPLHIQIAG